MRLNAMTDSAAASLRRELRSVARDAEALLRATAEIADDGVQEARDRASSTLRRAQKLAGDGAAVYAREAAYQASRYVRKHPWSVLGTVATLAGAGMLIGWLTRKP